MKLTSCKSPKTYGNLQTEVDGENIDTEGHVYTPNGIVRVYSTKYRNPITGATFNRTSLRFIHAGRDYYQHDERFYRPRYLVTLARRLAEEVCA